VVDREDVVEDSDTEQNGAEPVADSEQQSSTGSHKLLVTLVGLLVVSVLGFVASLILFGGGDEIESEQGSQQEITNKTLDPPVLVMRLSAQERDDLTAFLLDGVPQELPPERQYVLTAGDHELVLRRDGFQEIRQTVKLVNGVRRDYRPPWRPATGSSPSHAPLPKLGSDFQSTAVDGFTSGYGRMVGHWKFDGDAQDDTGSVNRSTLIGNPRFVDGQTGRALRLVEHQRFEVTEPLFVDSSEFSLTFWIRLDRVPNTRRPTLNGGELAIHLEDGSPKLRVQRLEPATDERTDERTKGFTGIDIGDHLNQWIHLGVVYSSPAQQVHYYLNGEHKGFQRYAGSAPAEMSRLEIGSLAAEIDDLRIFDYRLSSVAIKAIVDGDFQPLLVAPDQPNRRIGCEIWNDVPEGLTQRQIERITSEPADDVTPIARALATSLPAFEGSCLNRIRGFLYPPEDDEYVFVLRSSGSATLHLQRYGPDEETLAQIVVDDAVGTRSDPVSLERDKAYYFEINHQYDGRRVPFRPISLGCVPVEFRKRKPLASAKLRSQAKAIPIDYLASYGDLASPGDAD